MPRHEHTEVTYETTDVVDEETGERAQYTACSDCGKLLRDPHNAAPQE